METRNLKNNPFSPEEEENLIAMGAVGFTAAQVAAVFELDPNMVKNQFRLERGEIYEIYYKGRLQSELEIRSAVLKSAKNGSTPAQQQMQEYYSQADDNQRELQYEQA